MTLHVEGGNPADPFRKSLERFCAEENALDEGNYHFRAYGYDAHVYFAPQGVFNEHTGGYVVEIEGWSDADDQPRASWHDRFGMYVTADEAICIALKWCRDWRTGPPQGQVRDARPDYLALLCPGCGLPIQQGHCPDKNCQGA